MRWSCFLLVTACLALSADDSRILRDIDSSGVVDRSIIVPSGELTTAAVEERCREFLAEYASNRELARLTIGTRENVVNFALSGFYRISVQERYEDIATAIREGTLPRGPLARLIWFRNAALLTYVDGSNRREVIFAGGRDPTQFTIRGALYRLLHFNTEGPDLAVSTITLYFKAEANVSVSEVAALLALVRDSLRVPAVTIKVKQSYWFVEAPDFPPVYPFEDAGRLPRRTALDEPYIVCSYRNRETLCAGSGFRP